MLKPWAGVEVTSDDSLYGVVGLLADIDIDRRWVFTPGAGVGYYDEGEGRNLGRSVEFRTQLEFARRLARDHRVAFAFSHISNARLSSTNPGNESLTVYYSIPLGRESAEQTKEPPP